MNRDPARIGSDLLESALRVVRNTRWPTRRGIAEFFGNQLLVNGVAWTAGLLMMILVRHFLLRVIVELRMLRAERVGDRETVPTAAFAAASSLVIELEVPELGIES